MSKSRLVKLKGFKDVVIGRDLNNILKEGVIYSILSFDGLIVLSPMDNQKELPQHLKNARIDQILVEGNYLLTKNE